MSPDFQDAPSEPNPGRWPLHILLAEDNVDLAVMYATMLRIAGHEVAIARDGQQALDRLGGVRPDLVILDMDMPVLNGVEALGRIRLDDRLRDLPVLIFTNAELEPEQLAPLEQLGIEAWMTKISMQPSDLNGWLSRWSEGRGEPVRRDPPEERSPHPK